MNSIRLIASLTIGLVVGSAQAASIAILNHSFEAPVVAAGAANNSVTNWQDFGAAGDNGVFRGGGDFNQLAAPTHGSQIAFMNDLASAALVQTLSSNYQAGLDYSLTVDIAARTTVGALDGATLVLYRGSIANLAALNASNTVATFTLNGAAGLTNDVFNTFTLNATAAQVAAVSGVGQAIGIGIIGRVSSAGGQNQDLDNVRLEATPANDTDGDTLPDTWELAQTGVTSLNDLTNAGSGTPPGPGTGDYDGDGLADVDEFSKGTNAGRADSDSDGLNDGAEVSGAQNPYQVGHVPANPPGGTPGAPTLPANNDSDGDGILDGEEVVAGSDGFVTNPNATNTDGDGANDAAEVAAGTNPTVPDGPLTPLQLSFQKDYQVRNYFNSSVPLSGLDLTQDVLAGTAHPRIHLTSPGCTFSQNGAVLQISNSAASTQESLISLGKINNYTAIDLDLSGQTHTSGTATALLSLHSNANNRIVISQRDIDSTNKTISLAIIKNGTTVTNQTLSTNGMAAPNTLRMHLTGVYLNFLTVKNGGAPVHLATIDISPYFDLRTKTLLDTFTLVAGARLASGESVSITRLEHFLTSGTSQADPKVIHYENGAPMVEGNTIWVAMTARGYGPIPSSYQSIYSYDLVTKAWKIAAVLAFDNGDGKLRPWCAGDVLFDRTDQKWKAFVVSHGDDHKIYYGESTNDLRNGYHEIAASVMNYPSIGNEEDPSVLYDEDAGKWRMAMCKNSGGYQTVLFESASANGAWNQIGIYTPTSSTGILIQKIGGQRYVFLGRGSTPCPMEVLSYPGMQKLGGLTLDVHPSGNNIWPAIIPLTYPTGTKYYLLTFDRSGLFPGWSYGNIHWYEADEFASGFLEYANEVINPAGNYASWIGGYDVGTQTGFSDDPDGDGLRNGMEAFFGTDPGVSNAGLTGISKAANTITFKHPNPDIPLSDVTGSYEWSPDLNTWYAANGVAGDGNTTVTAVATPNNPAANTTTVVATTGGMVTSKMFIRVLATTP